MTPAYRYLGAYGGRGSGKCLGRGTAVRMFNGCLALVEDLKAGDQLMGPDSKPRTIKRVYSGTGPLFRVDQKTGISFVVNGTHLLSMQKSSSAMKDGRYPEHGETAIIEAAAFAGQSERFRSHFYGYRVQVEYPEEDQPVDPYFLGLWLGDGDAVRPCITAADVEIIEYLQAFARGIGADCRVDRKPGQSASRVNLVSQWRRDGILQDLRTLKVLSNKHIPMKYLTASVGQRLQLLAGLVDSDGHASTGTIEITQKSHLLAQDVMMLAWSLGFKASMARKTATCQNGFSGDVYRVCIGGDIDRIPCKIARKKAALVVKKNKDWRRTRIDVTPIGKGDYFGFELDGDHCFLLGDGTVTHNSHEFAEMAVERLVIDPDCKGVCIRETQVSLKFSSKALIEEKISKLGVAHLFDIQDKIIRRKGGKGFIIFAGMQQHNAESIKSLEGMDWAWIEEAQSLSKRSLSLLRPTIRKDKSQIWASWNPDKPEDAIDDFFRNEMGDGVLNGGNPDTISIQVNYQDNPYPLSDALQKEIAVDAKGDWETFEHVWLGGYNTRSATQIFSGKFRVEEFDIKPEWDGPYYGADWGFSVDPTYLIEIYLFDGVMYWCRESGGVGWEMEDIGPNWLKDIPEAADFKVRADNSRPETISYVRRKGGFRRLEAADKWKGSVEDGVEWMRSYKHVIHPACPRVHREFRLYSYKVNKAGDILTDIVDKENHTIDAGRYALAPLIQNKRRSIYDGL